MNTKNLMTVAAILLVGSVSFFAGFSLKQPVYTAPELILGPVQVTAQDISKFEREDQSDGQSLFHFDARPSVISAIAGYTEKAVGEKMDVRINGKLVNSVHIAEPISNPFGLSIALTPDQAQELEMLLKKSGRFDH